MKSLPLLLICSIAFFACNNNEKVTSKQDSAQAQSKPADTLTPSIDMSWTKFIAKSNISQLSKPEVIIDVNDPTTKTEMENCFDAFLSLMRSKCSMNTDPTIYPRRSRLTRHVYFGSGELKKWFDDYHVFDSSQELELKFGIYTPAFLHQVHATDSMDRVGRLGLFLVPSKENGDYATTAAGAKIPAYDLGGLYP